MAMTPPDDRTAPPLGVVAGEDVPPRADPGSLLEVTAGAVDGVEVLTLGGDVDLVTAPRLIEAILTGLAAALTGLIVDLSEVDFLASAGMTVLVEAHQAAADAAKWFAVVADGPSTSRPMKLVGLDREIRLYPTLDDALDAVV